MASGSSKSTTNSTTNSTQASTQTTTPTPPSFLSDPWKAYADKVASFGGVTPTATGASGLQQQAFSGASNLTASPAIGQGLDVKRGLLDYMPTKVGASTIAGVPDVAPSLISGAAPITFGSVSASPISAGLLSDADLSKYMNPFQQSVIDTTLGDLAKSKDQTIASNQAAATAAGAFGGSRHGVVDSLTNDDYLRTVASTVANLNQQNFAQAQAGATGDINRKLTADTFNSGQAVDVAKYNTDGAYRAAVDNAARQIDVQKYNADATYRAGVDNALRQLQVQQFNAGANERTDQFNAGQDAAGAAFRSGIGGDLISGGLSADANNRSLIGLLGDLGGTQREIDQDQNPYNVQLKQLLAQAGLLGEIPANLFTGSTTDSSGTSSGTGTGVTTSSPSMIGQLSGLLGGVGGLLSGIGSLQKV